MQNLKYPKKKVFLSDVDIKNVKLFVDSSDNRFVLNIANEGLNVKGTNPGANYNVPTATKVQKGINYLSRTVTNYGYPSSFLVKFNNRVNVDGGKSLSLGIREFVERPGFDTSRGNKEVRVFTGEVVSPSVNNGVVSEADMNIMKALLMKDIQSSYIPLSNKSYESRLHVSAIARKVALLSSYGNMTVKSDMTHTVAQAETTVRYTVVAADSGDDYVDWGTASGEITVTEAEAQAMGINTTSNPKYKATKGTLGTAGNFTFTKGVEYNLKQVDSIPTDNTIASTVYPVDEVKTAGSEFYRTNYLSPYVVANIGGSIAIMGTKDFEDFYVSAVGLTVDYRLWIRGASSYVVLEAYAPKADIEVSYFKIDITDTGGTNYYNTGTRTPDGLVNLNNILQLRTFDDINFHSLGRGSFPVLTLERIQEDFRGYSLSITGLEAVKGGSMPTAKEHICYELGVDMSTPDLHGASHVNAYEQRVLIYVPKTIAQTNKWDTPSSNWNALKADTASNAGVDFEDILAYLTGTAISSWK
jgi:hypothetical protein